MKLKNVNFFQLHVEKIILGSALLLALVLVFVYAVSPHTAKVAGQDLGPTEIEDKIVESAQRLQAKLDDKVTDLPEMAVAQYTSAFKTRVGSPVTSLAKLPPLGNTGLDPATVNPGGDVPTWVVPAPPIPANPIARASHALLGEVTDSRDREAVVSLIGDQQPADFRYVSVTATFPMNEWLKRLEQSPNLASQFYRGIVDIAGVYLQREELDPATGEWINNTIIEPMPTQAGFTPTYAFEFDRPQADAALAFIKQNQQRIARPDFLPVAEGSLSWLPPDAEFGNISAEEHRELAKLRDQIRREEKMIQQMMDRQKALANRAANRSAVPAPQPRFQRGGPEDFDMGEFGPGGPGGRPPRQMAPMPTAADEEGQRLQKLMTDLENHRRRYEEIVGVPPDSATGSNTGQMGAFDPYSGQFGPEGMPPEMMAPDGPYGPGMGPMGPMGQYGQFGPPPEMYGQRPGAPANAGAEVAEGDIKVWAHDLTVEPGKTYRYRVLVSVINPLFRQGRVPPEQKQENYNKIAIGPDLEGEAMTLPWSDPVRVDPEYYFFVLQASSQSQEAQVEIWRIYNGQWHYEKFPAQPGDVIGGMAKIKVNGADQQIPMNVGAVVVDVAPAGGSGPTAGQARMLYLEPGSQALIARNPDEDSDSPDRVRLQNERALQEAQSIASTAAR